MKSLAMIRPRKIHIAGMLAAITLIAAAMAISGEKKEGKIGVTVTGVHHLGPDFNIPEVYLNGGYVGNIGQDGGGGSFHCCAMLPTKWRPGLVAEVKWSVTDWRKENLEETDKGNYSSLITVGNYKATVPIERYEVPGMVYIHFFPNGKVRFVSTNTDPSHPLHPISEQDAHASDIATAGSKLEPSDRKWKY